MSSRQIAIIQETRLMTGFLNLAGMMFVSSVMSFIQLVV